MRFSDVRGNPISLRFSTRGEANCEVYERAAGRAQQVLYGYSRITAFMPFTNHGLFLACCGRQVLRHAGWRLSA